MAEAPLAAAFQLEALSHLISLAVEPVACVAAAVVVRRATRSGASLLQQLLVPGLLLVGGLEALDALTFLAPESRWDPLLPWLLAGDWNATPDEVWQWTARRCRLRISPGDQSPTCWPPVVR
mgnify:CR=1 FL=1